MIYFFLVNTGYWHATFFNYSKAIIYYFKQNNINIIRINNIKNIQNDDYILCFSDQYEQFKLYNLENIILFQSENIFSKDKQQTVFANNIIKYQKNIKYIVDYNYQNIVSYKKLNLFTDKYIHIPLIYSPVYKIISQNCQKKYDVFFYGGINKRRKRLKNRIQSYLKNHLGRSRVLFGSYYDENKLIRKIKKSKIVIFCYASNNHSSLDTYRCNLLLSNKIFFIHEKIDFNSFPDKNIKNNMIFSEYNNFPHMCLEYLKISQEERNKIAEKSYNYIENKYSLDKTSIKQIFDKKILEKSL